MNKEYKTENIPNKKIDTENIFGVSCNFEVFGFKENQTMFLRLTQHINLILKLR